MIIIKHLFYSICFAIYLFPVMKINLIKAFALSCNQALTINYSLLVVIYPQPLQLS